MNLKPEKLAIPAGKISRQQKKIFSAALIVAASIIFFWLFIYMPQSRKFERIKKELAATESRIAQITSLAEGKDLSAAVSGLKVTLLKVLSQLPMDDEKVIAYLSDGARRLKVEVKNIAPQQARPVDTGVPGYQIMEFPISLNLNAEYRAIGEYLSALRNNFPILIRVRDIQIQSKGFGRADLDAAVQLSAYLAVEKR
jgi:Tfp pilus assembly protein PilO